MFKKLLTKGKQVTVFPFTPYLTRSKMAMFWPIFWKIEHGDPLILFHFLNACAMSNRFWHKNWHILFDPTLSRAILKGKFGGKWISHVLGFVVLRDLVKLFPVSSSSFAKKTTWRNRARSHSGAWRGLNTKWDLKLSLPSPTYLIRYVFIWVRTTTPKLNLDSFQLWQLRSLNFQSSSDPSEIRWRVRGAREVPASRDSLNFRRASLLSRNEFESGTFTNVLHATSSFTLCFCHLWCELPL